MRVTSNYSNNNIQQIFMLGQIKVCRDVCALFHHSQKRNKKESKTQFLLQVLFIEQYTETTLEQLDFYALHTKNQ